MIVEMTAEYLEKTCPTFVAIQTKDMQKAKTILCKKYSKVLEDEQKENLRIYDAESPEALFIYPDGAANPLRPRPFSMSRPWSQRSRPRSRLRTLRRSSNWSRRPIFRTTNSPSSPHRHRPFSMSAPSSPRSRPRLTPRSMKRSLSSSPPPIFRTKNSLNLPHRLRPFLLSGHGSRKSRRRMTSRIMPELSNWPARMLRKTMRYRRS